MALTYLQTMEVAIARVYNWDVAERRKEKTEGKTEDESTAKGPPKRVTSEMLERSAVM